MREVIGFFGSAGQVGVTMTARSTAEVYAPNGEMIAAQTCDGSWIEIQTKAETKLIDASTDIYAKAYSAARAEMKAAAQVPMEGTATSVDIRA